LISVARYQFPVASCAKQVTGNWQLATDKHGNTIQPF